MLECEIKRLNAGNRWHWHFQEEEERSSEGGRAVVAVWGALCSFFSPLMTLALPNHRHLPSASPRPSVHFTASGVWFRGAPWMQCLEFHTTKDSHAFLRPRSKDSCWGWTETRRSLCKRWGQTRDHRRPHRTAKHTSCSPHRRLRPQTPAVEGPDSVVYKAVWMTRRDTKQTDRQTDRAHACLSAMRMGSRRLSGVVFVFLHRRKYMVRQAVDVTRWRDCNEMQNTSFITKQL